MTHHQHVQERARNACNGYSNWQAANCQSGTAPSHLGSVQVGSACSPARLPSVVEVARTRLDTICRVESANMPQTLVAE